MAERKTLLLRLNPKMWEEINRWAEEEFRSINGQIEYILQDAIKKHNNGSRPHSDKAGEDVE